MKNTLLFITLAVAFYTVPSALAIYTDPAEINPVVGSYDPQTTEYTECYCSKVQISHFTVNITPDPLEPMQQIGLDSYCEYIFKERNPSYNEAIINRNALLACEGAIVNANLQCTCLHLPLKCTT